MYYFICIISIFVYDSISLFLKLWIRRPVTCPVSLRSTGVTPNTWTLAPLTLSWRPAAFSSSCSSCTCVSGGCEEDEEETWWRPGESSSFRDWEIRHFLSPPPPCGPRCECPSHLFTTAGGWVKESGCNNTIYPQCNSSHHKWVHHIFIKLKIYFISCYKQRKGSQEFVFVIYLNIKRPFISEELRILPKIQQSCLNHTATAPSTV